MKTYKHAPKYKVRKVRAVQFNARKLPKNRKKWAIMALDGGFYLRTKLDKCIFFDEIKDGDWIVKGRGIWSGHSVVPDKEFKKNYK